MSKGYNVMDFGVYPLWERLLKLGLMCYLHGFLLSLETKGLTHIENQLVTTTILLFAASRNCSEAG